MVQEGDNPAGWDTEPLLAAPPFFLRAAAGEYAYHPYYGNDPARLKTCELPEAEWCCMQCNCKDQLQATYIAATPACSAALMVSCPCLTGHARSHGRLWSAGRTPGLARRWLWRPYHPAADRCADQVAGSCTACMAADRSHGACRAGLLEQGAQSPGSPAAGPAGRAWCVELAGARAPPEAARPASARSSCS